MAGAEVLRLGSNQVCSLKCVLLPLLSSALLSQRGVGLQQDRLVLSLSMGLGHESESHPVLSDPMDCSLTGSTVHGILQAVLSILQGILPTLGSNQVLLHCRWIIIMSEPPGERRNTGVGSLFHVQGIFPTQESNQGLLHCK